MSEKGGKMDLEGEKIDLNFLGRAQGILPEYFLLPNIILNTSYLSETI